MGLVASPLSGLGEVIDVQPADCVCHRSWLGGMRYVTSGMRLVSVICSCLWSPEGSVQ